MSGTVFALIVQGRKTLGYGDRVYDYGAGEYLVESVDLPVTGAFTEAPALGFGLGLGLEPRWSPSCCCVPALLVRTRVARHQASP